MIDYPDLLRRRTDRWRQAVEDRNLDPDSEKAAEIRRSQERHAARRAPLIWPRPASWIHRIRGRVLR